MGGPQGLAGDVVRVGHGEEQDEQAVDSDREEDAGAQMPVSLREFSHQAGLPAGLAEGFGEAVEAAWRFSASFTA